MAQSGEVVIVGGGVAGCATAYFLSLAGVKATIIEREGISSQASGFSAGGLNPLEGSCIPGPCPRWLWRHSSYTKNCGARCAGRRASISIAALCP